MKINSWDDMYKVYPEYRDEMTQDRERNFVNDCFSLYEKEGFAKVFWSCGGDYKEYHGKPFKVLGRATEKDVDLECLPMWNIQFEDGFVMQAYPDEIIPSEMREHGCPLENIVHNTNETSSLEETISSATQQTKFLVGESTFHSKTHGER